MAVLKKTTGSPEQGISTENLLPLDAAKLAVWTTTGKVRLCHVFRRITQADWKACFADSNEPGLTIYRRAILSVESLTQGDDVAAPVPLESVSRDDRMGAFESLQSLFWRFATDSFSITENGRLVAFEIASSDGAPGPMRRYFSVSHLFRLPSDDQHERFFLARQPENAGPGFTALVSLYDELVERVEGYRFAGAVLQTREGIIREMDAYHKAVAVALLFAAEEMRTLKTATVPASTSAVGPRTFVGLGKGKAVN